MRYGRSALFLFQRVCADVIEGIGNIAQLLIFNVYEKKVFCNLLTFMMVAMLSVGFASCGSDDDNDAGSISNDIIGTWVAHGGKRTVTYVFESDGTGKSSHYWGDSSGYWRRGEGVFTWGRKGNTVTVNGGYWTTINSDGETDEGTYNETFEYNGSTLTGGRFGDANVYYKQ